ncbi:hypothetical protein JKA74_15270 [Marivirga sp. S37H4]|uniref:Uncharacterized protein n=1 Tax=Marivirga aurantiaca TaxID=2802615 RepID=A0A934X0H0_9BACT|nr:hypothetical protein [Marivirga aurantiaca]MBK6266404.1 hypothetical protein [Marivirga aurantiaca]
MFSEAEIAIIIKDEEIDKIVDQLKQDFITNEAPYMEISNHDFLSLILLSTDVGKKMANKHVSFSEEMSLQKKARKYSKGGFFLSSDPVVDGLKFLLKNFDAWEDKFYAAINKCSKVLFRSDDLQLINDKSIDFETKVMYSPYLLIRFISSLFLERDEDILNPGTIKKVEFDKLTEIGSKIGLSDYLIFNEFMAKYELK